MNLVKIPGKVMLSGEYAVLEGAKAVLAPVNRFLEVWEENKPSTETSPVIKNALDEHISALEEYEKEHGKPEVFINRDAFYEINKQGHRAKLGLGSSAAEAVGVIALRFQRAGIEWEKIRNEVAVYAEVAHRKAQDGKGSGADVYTCTIGRPIEFQRVNNEVIWKLIEPDTEYRVPIHLLWTGVPADTRIFVWKFNEWKQNYPSSDTKLKNLIEASDILAKSWFRVPQDVLNNHIDVFVSRMQEIALEAGIAWRLPVHDELTGWMFDQGGRAKPTGAGGGDLVLLVGNCDLQSRSEITLKVDLGF